mgnify:CR=1 FL=1
MGYICLNEDCFAPENKKGKEYPVAMECPFCDVPLTQQFNFTEQEQNLIDSLPYVIAYPLQKTLEQTHYWTKLNLFKDTFLNYLKYLGLITASEFFNSDFKNRNMISLFQNTLAEPSFGTWNLYIRETLKFLEEQNHHFFCKELPEYYQHIETGKKRKLFKGEIQIINSNGEIELKKQQATAIGMLINFRNRYLGHGLTIDEDNSKTLWDEYSPIFFNLLEKMCFTSLYPMFKNEHGETIKLHSAQLKQIENKGPLTSKVWLENNDDKLDIIPFFIVPGEVAISKEDKEQLLTYESYTWKSIKFFSPEGTEKQTSGKMLERLNLLLKEKQIEKTYSPSEFTEEIFSEQIKEYNKYTLQTLISERKIIPGVYINRNDIESKLRNWIGSRASIFFIAAEAGSGKTNLLVEKQKFYNEKGFKSFLIRAGRMNKQSLTEEIKYIINAESTSDLNSYKHFEGTQANPTFILIDGLNEAINYEEIWFEILSLSKMFKPGSLKFVVTSRINSQADLERYSLSNSIENLIYRENSDGDNTIKSFAFWLTPLNMKETKKAWEAYCKKDKSKFKPSFTFDDIAEIDRSIYDQISNPLILRVFLEVYNSKNLIKKGKKHINIWEDWFNTFNQDEKDFMMILANEIWIKGENELLLEDLLNHSEIKKYLLSDALNSPYTKLKNLGWIGRFTKDLDLIITFTVEGLLIYIIGKILESKVSKFNLTYLDSILEEDKILKTSGVEEYLSLRAILGDIDLISELIDKGGKGIDISTKPILNYIKVYGVQSLEEKLMKKPTEGDWKALLSLDLFLKKLSLEKLRKSLAETFIKLSKFKSKAEIEYGLLAIVLLENEIAKKYFKKLNDETIIKSNSTKLIDLLSDCYLSFSKFDIALNYLQLSLKIKLNILTPLHHEIANSYNNIAEILDDLGKYDLALEYLEKCLKIRLSKLGDIHPDTADVLVNIGLLWRRKGKYKKALKFYEKAEIIIRNNYGDKHSKLAEILNNISVVYRIQGNYSNSLEFIQKCLSIELNVFGKNHNKTAITYNNFGKLCTSYGLYSYALEAYEDALEIRLKINGKQDPKVGVVYSNLGQLFYRKANEFGNLEYYKKSLDFHEKALDIRKDVFGIDHPDTANSFSKIGVVLSHLNDGNKKALEYCNKALKIRQKVFEKDNPRIASSFHDMGLILSKTGNNLEALKYHNKSLKIRLKALNENNPDVTESRYLIGLIYKKIGKFTQSINILKLGYKLDREIHKSNRFDIDGMFPMVIAECFEELKNTEEAINYYTESAENTKNDNKGEDYNKAAKKAFSLAKENNLEHTLPEWIKNLY